MSDLIKLSVDVGGTHTDGVIRAVINGKEETIARIKLPTTENISDGVMNVMQKLLENSGYDASDIDRIQFGTTHFINAIKERKGLEQIALLRVSRPSGDVVQPFALWPEDLEEVIDGHSAIIHGGFQYKGEPLNFRGEPIKLSGAELSVFANAVIEKGLKRIVISSPYAVQFPGFAYLAKEKLMDVLSIELNERIVGAETEEEISRLEEMRDHGFDILLARDTTPIATRRQRENAASLNASLKTEAEKIFGDFQERLESEGFASASLLITSNDGGFMTVEEAMKRPFDIYDSGPINSIRGAAILTGFENALVVDIGGSTTDVGLIDNGAPHMLNFSKAEDQNVDLMMIAAHQRSIALGGGTCIEFDEENNPILSSSSVGYKLYEKARFAGGDVFTTTDLAILIGRLDFYEMNHLVWPEASKEEQDKKRDEFYEYFISKGLIDISHEPTEKLLRADMLMHEKIAQTIESTRINADCLPIVLVGGGAALVDGNCLLAILARKETFDYGEIVYTPEDAGVANAVGASAAKVLLMSTYTVSIDDELNKLIDETLALPENNFTSEEMSEEEVILIRNHLAKELRPRVKKEQEQKAIDLAKRQAIEKRGALAGTVEMISCRGTDVPYSSNGLVDYKVTVQGVLSDDLCFSSDEQSTEMPEEVDFNDLYQEEAYETMLGPALEDVEEKISEEKAPEETEDDETKKLVSVLTDEDVRLMAIGFGYLGSGGGGDPVIGEIPLRSAIQARRDVLLADFDAFDDEDYVCLAGYVGMPSVINESGLGNNAGPAAIKKLESLLSERNAYTIKIVGVISFEGGGMNPLGTAVHSSTLDLPIVNADAMGRAFPNLFANTVNVAQTFHKEKQEELLLVIADDSGEAYQIEAPSLFESDIPMYAKVAEGNGFMFSAFSPMKVKDAKAWCIHNTFKSAIEIGRLVEEGLALKKPIDEILIEALSTTHYWGKESIEENEQDAFRPKVRIPVKGSIKSVNSQSTGSHNCGEAIIHADDGRNYKVSFKNENLLLWDDEGNIIEHTPDIITLVNPDTGLAIGSNDFYHPGLKVMVVVIDAPPMLKTPEALNTVVSEDVRELIAKNISQKQAERVGRLSDAGSVILFQAKSQGVVSEVKESESPQNV